MIGTEMSKLKVIKNSKKITNSTENNYHEDKVTKIN